MSWEEDGHSLSLSTDRGGRTSHITLESVTSPVPKRDSSMALELGDTAKLKNVQQLGRHDLANVRRYESGMVAVKDRDDIVNCAVVGLWTRTLYKAAAGPRSAVVAGAFDGMVVGLAVTGKKAL
ncbi:hypothetical protein LguiA_010023 [Lonicera macranthoides]